MTVGAGGKGGTGPSTNGVQGGPSVFGPGPIAATGVGYGGYGGNSDPGAGGDGGSGGGAGEGRAGGDATNFPGPTQQGNPGGSGNASGPDGGGGGGGGDGGAGANGPSTAGGAGGIGTKYQQHSVIQNLNLDLDQHHYQVVDWEHQDLVAHISGLPVVVEEEPS